MFCGALTDVLSFIYQILIADCCNYVILGEPCVSRNKTCYFA